MSTTFMQVLLDSEVTHASFAKSFMRIYDMIVMKSLMVYTIMTRVGISTTYLKFAVGLEYNFYNIYESSSISKKNV